MRILQVLDLYAPLLGGAQIQTQLLSEQLTERGHDVAVVTIWQEGLAKREVVSGVPVRRIQGWLTRLPWLYQIPARRDSAPVPDPGLTLGIRRAVREFQPDVVMVYGWIVYSCAFALMGTGIPLVVSSRDYSYTCSRRTLMRNGAELCSGPGFAKCMACASERFGNVKGKLVAAGVLGGRSIVRASGTGYVNVSHYVRDIVQRDLIQTANRPNRVIFDLSSREEHTAPDPQILAQLPDEPFILYVGSVARYKGIYVLLRAYEQLESPPPLVIMGIMYPDSPDEFPPGVTLFRQVPHATVLAAWERCLFGVVPSIWPDPLPNVTLEAMSQGKPVVGTAAGGIPDMIVHGESGLLFPLGDVSALREAMQSLVDDPALVSRLGQGARQRIREHFSEEIVVKQFEAYFEDLIASKGNVNYDAAHAKLDQQQ